MKKRAFEIEGRKLLISELSEEGYLVAWTKFTEEETAELMKLLVLEAAKRSFDTPLTAPVSPALM